MAYKRISIEPDDTEGHAWKRIDLEVDDTEANLLRAATDRGEPVYVRFPDGAEVHGHAYKSEDLTVDDTEAHRKR